MILQILIYILFTLHAKTKSDTSSLAFCFLPGEQDRKEMMQIEIVSIVSRYILEFAKETCKPDQKLLNLYITKNDLDQLFTYYRCLLTNIILELEKAKHQNKFKKTIQSFTTLMRMIDTAKNMQHGQQKNVMHDITTFMSKFKYTENRTEDITILQDFTLCLLSLCFSKNCMGGVIYENQQHYLCQEQEPIVFVFRLGDVRDLFDQNYKKYNNFVVKIDETILMNIICKFDRNEFLNGSVVKLTCQGRRLKFIDYLKSTFPGLSTNKRCTDIKFSNCVIFQHKLDLIIRHEGIYRIDESDIIRKRFLDYIEIIKEHFRTVFVGEKKSSINVNEVEINITVISNRASFF